MRSPSSPYLLILIASWWLPKSQTQLSNWTTKPHCHFSSLNHVPVVVFLDFSIYFLPLSQIQLIQSVLITISHQLISVTVILPVSQPEKLASSLTYSSSSPLMIWSLPNTAVCLFLSKPAAVTLWKLAGPCVNCCRGLLCGFSVSGLLPLPEILPSTPFSACYSSAQISLMILPLLNNSEAPCQTLKAYHIMI